MLASCPSPLPCCPVMTREMTNRIKRCLRPTDLQDIYLRLFCSPLMSNERVVIHIDFNAFYCGVEQRFDPTLTDDVPFIVYQKQIVATASYAARKLGVPKLSSLQNVKDNFPSVRMINGESLAKYRSEGRQLWTFVKSQVFGDYAPVQRLGLEELWIDISGIVDYNLDRLYESGILDAIQAGHSIDEEGLDGWFLSLSTSPYGQGFQCDDFFFEMPGRLFLPKKSAPGKVEMPPNPQEFSRFFGSPSDRSSEMSVYIGAHIAAHLQERILLEMRYSCSIGVAGNKTLAKMIGDQNKPKGLTILLPSDAENFLGTMPVVKIPYCGRKAVKILRRNLESRGIFPREVNREAEHMEKEMIFKHLELGLVQKLPVSDAVLDAVSDPFPDAVSDAVPDSILDPVLYPPARPDALAVPDPNVPDLPTSRPSVPVSAPDHPLAAIVPASESHSPTKPPTPPYWTPNVNTIRSFFTIETISELLGVKQAELIWGLIHGIDNSPVEESTEIPTQISIEDTFIKVYTLKHTGTLLKPIVVSLLKQISSDLIDMYTGNWLSYPTVIRLSVRCRLHAKKLAASGAPGVSNYGFGRISKSTPVNPLLYTLGSLDEEELESLADKILASDLIWMLHSMLRDPVDIHILNVAVTGMSETMPEVTSSKRLQHKPGPTRSKRIDQLFKGRV